MNNIKISLFGLPFVGLSHIVKVQTIFNWIALHKKCPRLIKAGSFFISQIESILLVEPLFKHLNIMVVVLYEAHVAALPEQLPPRVWYIVVHHLGYIRCAKVIAAIARTTVPRSVNPKSSPFLGFGFTKLARLICSIITPFGFPVLPDVKIM